MFTAAVVAKMDTTASKINSEKNRFNRSQT